MSKLPVRVTAVFLTLAALAFPSSSAADPVRVSIEFSVVGADADPDFGDATADGSFSFVTAQEPGTDVLRPEGFGLLSMSFTWAGVDWTTANADVYRVGREPDGRVFAVSLGGTPSGLDLSLATPDVRLLICVSNVIITPEGFCSHITFDYSTSRSAALGTFTAFVSGLSITREPVDAPIPEPMTLLLVASGLGAFAARRR
jgi:hypothetical protein